MKARVTNVGVTLDPTWTVVRVKARLPKWPGYVCVVPPDDGTMIVEQVLFHSVLEPLDVGAARVIAAARAAHLLYVED